MQYTTEAETRERLAKISIGRLGPIPSRPCLALVRRKLKERHVVWALNNGRLCDRKLAMLDILAETPEYWPIVHKVLACSPKRPCNNRWCPVCSDPKLRGRKARFTDDPNDDPRVCNVAGTRTGCRSSNYQVRGGQRMAEPFRGLPTFMLHPSTINLCLVGTDSDLAVLVRKFRKRLKRVFRSFSAGAIIRGMFDLKLKYADELTFDVPDDELPLEWRNGKLPHLRVGMLHVHFVVFDPLLTRQRIRGLLRMAFPGNNRVCVRSPREEIVHDDGTVTQGAQGYLEYASLEKIELEFGAESCAAVLEFARLDSTWGRANRNIRFGNRTRETERFTDPVVYTAVQAWWDFDECDGDPLKLDFGAYYPQHVIRGGSSLMKKIRNRRRLAHAIRFDIIHHRLRIDRFPYSCNSALVSGRELLEFSVLFGRASSETSGQPKSGQPP